MTEPQRARGPDDQAPKSLRVRLLWFVGLCLASLAVTAGAAYLLRGLLLIG